MTKLFRIDVTADDKLLFNEWTAAICQDTWITQAPIPEKIVEKSDFYFGWRGCDNHVAWLFRENLYHIINPCLKITTRYSIIFLEIITNLLILCVFLVDLYFIYGNYVDIVMRPKREILRTMRK